MTFRNCLTTTLLTLATSFNVAPLAACSPAGSEGDSYSAFRDDATFPARAAMNRRDDAALFAAKNDGTVFRTSVRQ